MTLTFTIPEGTPAMPFRRCLTKALTSLLMLLTAHSLQAQSYTILTDQPQQTIEHFGASDAWSMQTIGLWADTAQQRQIADWLFSLETDDDGQPRGIGLSVWRFNLGAGSAFQGDSSQINRGTRTECFLRPDSSYDFGLQQGQVRFMQMAKERGVPRLLAFLNSPPVYFTQNGLATNTGRGGTLNLRPDSYDAFARFMAEAVAGLEREHGLHIDYICPVNEPDGHWNWQGPKQEGSPATNRETARLVKATSKAFAERGLTTQIMVNESSDLRCLLGLYRTDWQRGNTIATFFNRDSTVTYLGDTPLVPHLILGHSYWTNTPVDSMKLFRQQLREATRRHGIGFWQTELCIMANDEEIGGGGGYDFTMKTALYVARVIHHDLCYANAASWSWWRACGGNYKDGLIRVWERQQRARDSRLLWALGNYSRFVRPGAVRYEVEGSVEEDPWGVMLSAFRNVDGSWVCVAINYTDSEQTVSLLFAPGDSSANPDDSSANVEWKMYRTSDADGEKLKPVGTATGGRAVLPKRSITTLVLSSSEPRTQD